MKNPKLAPQTSKKKMLEHILSYVNKNQAREGYAFIANVKFYCDADWDTIVQHFDDDILSGLPASVQKNPERFLQLAKKAYTPSMENRVFDRVMESLTYSVENDDAYQCIPTHDKKVWIDLEVKFVWLGRSGGWIAISKFEGNNLNMVDCLEDFDDWEFKDIRNFYKYLWLMETEGWTKHSTIAKKAEEKTAYYYFTMFCDDVITELEAEQEYYETVTTYAGVGGFFISIKN